MAFLSQLWIPIIVSAVGVFIASSLIHMVIKWHNSDYRKLGNEDDVRAAMNANAPAPGQYVVPYCADMKEMATPEMMKKYQDGPMAFMYVRPNGPPNMGMTLGLWFAFILVVSVICAYVASKVFVAGPPSFGGVARLVGALSFLAYAGGSVPLGIWYGKPWGSVMKDVADGFIYGAVTGAAFGWLWPR